MPGPALYNSAYHFGGVIVPPGYKNHVIDGLGNPYGTGHVTGEDGSIAVGEESLTAARAQGRLCGGDGGRAEGRLRRKSEVKQRSGRVGRRLFVRRLSARSTDRADGLTPRRRPGG